MLRKEINLEVMQVTEKIYIENCDNMELMARYPDNYFDLAIVDPPYGIGISSNSFRQKQKKKDWDNKIPSEKYFNELKRVSKNQIIWGGNYFDLPPSQGFLIWDKVQPQDFSSAMCEFAWSSIQSPAKIFKLHVVTAEPNKIHPTQKPAKLYKWLLEKCAKPNDKILDTHLGSMSIAIACADYGFELVGCELDPDYYNAGIKRLQNHLSQTKINFDI